jgi:hypothetical protein
MNPLERVGYWFGMVLVFAVAALVLGSVVWAALSVWRAVL